MNRKELLGKFIDATINGDHQAAEAAFKPYIESKSQETSKQLFNKKLLEFTGPDDPIQIAQDGTVTVKGKRVGKIVDSDPNDFESGINFVSADNKFSKEYDSIEDLINDFSQRFNIRESKTDKDVK